MANRRSNVPKRNINLHTVWRDAVLATNEHKCVCCGETEETTVIKVHHIVEYAKCPALGYDVLNGVVLCCRCHDHVHSGRKELADPISAAIARNCHNAVEYVNNHRNDPCPDYADKAVIAALRAKLRTLIPDDYMTYSRVYDLLRKDHHSDAMRSWREKNRDMHNEQSHQWYLAHKDRVKELSHARYEAHKEAVLARTSAYAAARRNKYNEYQRKYRAAHRDRINEIHRLSRLRVKQRQSELFLEDPT